MSDYAWLQEYMQLEGFPEPQEASVWDYDTVLVMMTDRKVIVRPGKKAVE